MLGSTFSTTLIIFQCQQNYEITCKNVLKSYLNGSKSLLMFNIHLNINTYSFNLNNQCPKTLHSVCTQVYSC